MYVLRDVSCNTMADANINAPEVPVAADSPPTQTKTQVCLLCEVIQKQIPAFNFFCASFESITAIEKLGKWWDCQLGNYTWGGGDSGGGGDVLPKGL
ncbi:hypothetical protein Tco_1327762 [Tanacetum coccineum]